MPDPTPLVLTVDGYDVHMVDPPTVGLWCGRCASHSAWEALYAITPRIDPTFTVWRGWFRRCNTCLGYITSAYPTA